MQQVAGRAGSVREAAGRKYIYIGRQRRQAAGSSRAQYIGIVSRRQAGMQAQREVR